jgi:hypothetical protein
LKPVGAPSSAGLSENEYWVFAMQMGILSSPSFSRLAICFFASAVNSTPSALYISVAIFSIFSAIVPFTS